MFWDKLPGRRSYKIKALTLCKMEVRKLATDARVAPLASTQNHNSLLQQHMLHPWKKNDEMSVLTCCMARLCNSPKGTKGFSLDFRINFSLNDSSLFLGSGVKPSITGGWEKSNGTPAVGGILTDCSGVTGEVVAAMFTTVCLACYGNTLPVALWPPISK